MDYWPEPPKPREISNYSQSSMQIANFYDCEVIGTPGQHDS